MSRELTRIKLREVALSGSRPSLPETVNALAESMRESGLINPITVRPAPVFDGTIMVSGYITTLIDDLFRMSRKFTPEQVAESIASRPLNPDLFPYVEAVYIAFRAESGGGKRRGEA